MKILENPIYCMCGCGQYGHHWHHALVHRIKRFSPWVDDPRNMVFVNATEHVDLKKFDNDHWRLKFWRRNVLRFGAEAMEDFRRSAPAKMDKNRFAFLNTEEN